MHVLDQTDSIANHFLAQLRDKEIQGDRMRFRKNLERLGELMAYEVSKTLDFHEVTVETPLGIKHVNMLVDNPVLISVLRAALPFYQGFLNFFDAAESGFVGAYRREESESGADVEVEYLYQAAPDLTNRPVILIDPMLASGKSFSMTVENLLRKHRPKSLHLCCLIAAPEGIEYLKKSVAFPYQLWVGSVDEKLNEKAYIVPGLGDAGDLSYGPKL